MGFFKDLKKAVVKAGNPKPGKSSLGSKGDRARKELEKLFKKHGK